jgi:hypothetical protein
MADRSTTHASSSWLNSDQPATGCALRCAHHRGARHRSHCKSNCRPTPVPVAHHCHLDRTHGWVWPSTVRRAGLTLYTPFVTTEHTDSNLQRLRISAERQRPCKAPTGCDGHSQLFWWWLQGKPQVCDRQRARTGAGGTWPGVQPAAAAYACWRAAVSKLVGHATYSPCPCCAIPHVGPPAQASRHRPADS